MESVAIPKSLRLLTNLQKVAPLNQVGNYKILKTLGEGGMGTVFLGEELTSKRQVAIKVVKTAVASDDEIIARFRQEIKISKSFAHPFVIKIIDGGVLIEQNLLYLVMEVLEGKDLKSAYANKRAENKDTEKILLHMAEALSYVHQRGIVHRDIKPDNIFIVSPNRTVLLDFGLALADNLTRLSKTSDRPGTFLTMSPEQLIGHDVDGRSDIYSLGITMYWLLTQTPPYDSDEIIAIAVGNSPTPPPSPHELDNTIDSRLSQIIMKCMAIDRKNRFSSADALLKTLQGKARINFSSASITKSKTEEDAYSSSKNDTQKLTPVKIINPANLRLKTIRKIFALTVSMIVTAIIIVVLLFPNTKAAPQNTETIPPDSRETQQWKALFHQATSLKTSYYSTPETNKPNDKKKIILIKILSICRKLKSDYPDDKLICTLAPLYYEVLSELDTHVYRKEGIDFLNKWVNKKNVPPIVLMKLYEEAGGMMMDTSSDWKSINMKDNLLALTYKKKALKIGKQINHHSIYQPALAIAKIYNRTGKSEAAQKLIRNLLIDHPEYKMNYHFVRRYASMLAENLRFNEAIKLLTNIIKKDNIEKILDDETRKDMMENIDNYKRYELLAKFKNSVTK